MGPRGSWVLVTPRCVIEYRKGQAAEMRKAKAKPAFDREKLTPLPLRSPRDMLTFKDLLRTPPHKTVSEVPMVMYDHILRYGHLLDALLFRLG